MTTPTAELTGWLAETIGRPPRDPALFVRALTHGSHGSETYERLEFLGDRVLGLVVADQLYRRFPGEPEGSLSRRFHMLVSGETCADLARAIGVPRHLRLGKQARDDGAGASVNVLGDVLEALIGALHLDAGFPAAEALILKLWEPLFASGGKAPQHPKSVLQEWALAHGGRLPTYTMVGRAGPHHAPRFTVEAAVPGKAEAVMRAEGTTKQEAETAAARALMEKLA